jgi:hypothetical protein
MVAMKYPNVSVRLVGEDGNAFAILGRVIKAMRHADVSKAGDRSIPEGGDVGRLQQPARHLHTLGELWMKLKGM